MNYQNSITSTVPTEHPISEFMESFRVSFPSSSISLKMHLSHHTDASTTRSTGSSLLSKNIANKGQVDHACHAPSPLFLLTMSMPSSDIHTEPQALSLPYSLLPPFLPPSSTLSPLFSLRPFCMVSDR